MTDHLHLVPWVKKHWSYTSTPHVCLHGMQKDNFTFYISGPILSYMSTNCFPKIHVLKLFRWQNLVLFSKWQSTVFIFTASFQVTFRTCDEGNAYVSVVIPLWICEAPKRAIWTLSGVEFDEADSRHACTRAQKPSLGKCWGCSDCLAVVLVAEDEWSVRLCECAAQQWASCVRAV